METHKNITPIIAGNWKMNPETRDDARDLFFDIRRTFETARRSHLIICPPAIHLQALATYKRPDNVFLGAQDCFWESAGSFTGETSPGMVRDAEGSFVIIGHSERRALGETDRIVSHKVEAVLNAGLRPIVCIGEESRDENGLYLQFLESQLKNSLASVTQKTAKDIIIAYEPVWAIGKSDKDAITGHLLHEVEVFIRRFLTHTFGKKQAFSVPVLYGGSVSSQNTQEIITEGNVNGLLIGRASRDARQFKDIISLVETHYGS